MPSAGSEATEAQSGVSTGNLGHLPWQQIPKFVPGTTNVDEYVSRMKFLKELWPEDQLHLLGPRAALQVEGSAFQKISRLSPEKLRQPDGVKILVETLGGSWGRTAMEEKYHYFEQAIFQVMQRNDETNDSYVSRHDAYFEELLARGVTIEQVRAYVLLRHSQLAPDDKKRVVVESQGDLKYNETVKAIRLLGSKFFGELQAKNSTSQGRMAERNRVYDVNFTEEDGQDETYYSATQDEEPDDEDLLCYFLEQNDPDAVYITEFEDSIVDAIQESDLAPVYISYQEARQKLRDKAKARGFWGPSKGRGKSKHSGKKGKGGPISVSSSWGMGRNRSLADRIANSSCRLCGARGHWKRECPRRQASDGREDQRNEVTHYTTESPQTNSPYFPEILHEMPQDAAYYMDSDESRMEDDRDEDFSGMSRHVAANESENLIQPVEANCFMAFLPKLDKGPSFKEVVASKLLMCARKNGRCTRDVARTGSEQSILSRGRVPKVLHSSKPIEDEDCVFIATTGSEGVLDTGASRTVVGSNRVPSILKGLDAEVRAGVRKTASEVVFKFGNSGTLKSKHALLLPTSESTWVRVEVIPGDTPLLISNRLLHELDAVIHVRKGYLQLPDKRVPLRKDAKGLSVVDLSALLCTTSADCLQAAVTQDTNRQIPPTNVEDKSGQPPTAQQATSSAQHPSSAACLQHAGFESKGGAKAPGQPSRSRCGCHPVGLRRSGSQRGADSARRIPRGHGHSARGNRDAQRLGSSATASRQAQSQVTQCRIRSRPRLCSLNGQKNHVDQRVGEILPAVQHRETSSNGSRREGEEGQGEGEPPGDGQAEGHQDSRRQRDGSRDEDGSSQPRGVGHGGVEAVPGDRFKRLGIGSVSGPEFQSFSLDQADQHGADEWSHEGRHVGGEEARVVDSSGAPAPRTRAVAADSRGRPEVSATSSTLNPEMEDQVLRLQELCKQIDACAFQIEEQLGQLNQDTEFHDWMQYKLPRLDVLEVTLTDHSLGNAVRRRQGRVVSIKTFNVNKVWQMMNMYEPRHLWIDCGSAIPSKVFGSKTTLLDLYEHQVELGRHFHLCCDRNIFEDSSLTGDPELQAILEETLCARHGPIKGVSQGRMEGNNFLNRTRYVYTTSRAVHHAVDTRKAQPILSKQHRQQHLSGASTSQHVTTRQLRLAETAAAALSSDHSYPLVLSELLVASHKREGDVNMENSDDPFHHAQQVVKRRRLWRKQPPPPVQRQPEDPVGSWGELFRRLGARVKTRGRFYFDEGDEVVAAAQRLTPHFQVKHVVMARGTNRVQLPKPGFDVGDIPLRQTIVVSRQDGKVRVDGEPEQWTRAPKYKRWRSAIPARISLTAYGAPRQYRAPPQQVEPQRELDRDRSMPMGQNAVQLESPVSAPPGVNGGPPPLVSRSASDQSDASATLPAGLEQGYPPLMIPRHGPGYLALSENEKREVGRLHQNLGHPDAVVMAKFLEERKADPRIIQGAKDYTCSACVETVPGPKPARPASIHVDGDFGDVVGMDVAYWTGKSGQQYMFTHIIDEATLFHQATATGRTVEDQYEALTDSWTKWAGPCQFLYLDPAGEYIGDAWREKIQRDGICVKVAAGESHWQVGRVESHGKILKGMLTRMDSEETISSDADFRQCLRAAIQAKNSLSRVRGFTPEQAVFGKSSRLPASLISDEQAASHALADSSLPEGLAFRQSLFRREQARAAFARVDNDGSYRRALLRKTRASLPTFAAGSWVLYWRQ